MYCHLRVIYFFTFAVCLTVGLNCTVEDCEEKAACPPDSELKPGGWGCICVPERCPETPVCHFRSKRIRKHVAAGIPGDCCDVYDCVFPSEVNCTGVVCQETEVDCPTDSYRLPKSQGEGECCSRPLGCACLPTPCPPPLCPQGQRHIVIRPGNGKPGSCCPFYQCESHENKTCMHNGKEVPTGSKWKKTECVECTCIDGQVHCSQSVTCPLLPLDCPATRIPPDQCCPVCVFNHSIMDIGRRIFKPDGCKSAKGIIYQNGASWQEDDCTHCTCADGERKCQAEMCLQTCANPTYVPGECCPRCNVTDVTVIAKSCPPLHCPIACKNGFVKDESECHICKCIEGEECDLECKSGFLKDGNGMNICECDNECPPLADCNKKCKHGYKTNKAGCEICKCEHCKPMAHCVKKCPHGYQINQKGCQICKCKEREPVNRTTEDGSLTEKKCVSDQGIRRDNGESWFENCRQCYCFEGKEMCSLVSCPRIDCPDPIFAKNACCPICPGNETMSGSEVLCYGPLGIKHEIETWKQGCLECLCHNGSILCYSEPCPPVLCQHPLEGDCCPVCPEGAVQPLPVLDPTQSCGDKEAGAKWRQSECTSCVCINGEASCFTQSCDQINPSCKTSVLLKKQCCPVCFDNMSDEEVCQVGNVTFNVGDEWEPEKCTRCVCGPSHTISCTQTICERPCSKDDNPCCPKCTEVEGEYEWYQGPIYLIIMCILMFGVGAGSVVLWKHCMLKRHQLKICQPTTPPYHYKYVPTYDQSVPSPHKSPV